MTEAIQLDNLTDEVVLHNIEVWKEALESGKFQRAEMYLRRNNPGSGGESYCCLGVAALLSGLYVEDEHAFVDTYGDRFTALCPPVVARAIGLYDQSGNVTTVHGELPEQYDDDPGNRATIDLLMSLNDTMETQDHWEDGFVLEQVRAVRDYWQEKVGVETTS